MTPTMGGVVFYHFMHENLDGSSEMRARPATVVEVYSNGVIDAHVCWNRSDNPLPRMDRATSVNRWVIMEPLVVSIPVHRDEGETGKIERVMPCDHTWTWPPRAI